MDYVFNPTHPTDHTDDFLKAIFKRQVKRVTAKAAKKAKLSPEKTKELHARTQQMISTGALGKKITNLNRIGNAVAIGAGTALTAGLATGAIALPAVGGIASGSKKILSKIKSKVASKVQDVVDPEPWLGGTQNKTTAGQALDALKNIAKEKAPELLQGLKEKGLQKVAEIINDNQTSPELLPKTAPQKQLEANVINGGATPMGALDSMIKNPLVIAAIVLLIIAVVVSLVKRNG